LDYRPVLGMLWNTQQSVALVFAFASTNRAVFNILSKKEEAALTYGLFIKKPRSHGVIFLVFF